MKVSQFDRDCMARAIALSKQSADRGESPFGAVISNSNRILAEGSNRTKSTGNPTRHAEIEALNSYFETHGKVDSNSLTLYTSCEPCLMCLGATHYAGIKRIIYGVTVKDILQFGSDDPEYSSEPVAKIAGMNIEFVSGILKDSAIEVLKIGRAHV